MGKILGIGCTHTIARGPAETMKDNYLTKNLEHPSTPPELRDVKNWPEQARREWGDDASLTTARKYLAELQKGFRLARKAIDEFKPDFVLIWADDQYENLREDCLPPFTVFAIDEVRCEVRTPTNFDATVNPKVRYNPPVTVKGHPEAARHIVRELIGKGFDVASSWKLPHGPSYGHSMTWSCDFLDLDQRGFYPVIPFAVNTYGVDLRIPYPENPNPSRLGRKLEGMPVTPPPAPVPWRCYDLGKAVAKIIEESPWRAVVVGSASWSHASLNTKSHYLWPDMEADRARREELLAGQQAKWRDLDAEQLNDAGQHEFLNWICLAGAMEGRKAQLLSLSEAYLFNSNRMVVLFPA